MAIILMQNVNRNKPEAFSISSIVQLHVSSRVIVDVKFWTLKSSKWAGFGLVFNKETVLILFSRVKTAFLRQIAGCFSLKMPVKEWHQNYLGFKSWCDRRNLSRMQTKHSVLSALFVSINCNNITMKLVAIIPTAWMFTYFRLKLQLELIDLNPQRTHCLLELFASCSAGRLAVYRVVVLIILKVETFW